MPKRDLRLSPRKLKQPDPVLMNQLETVVNELIDQGINNKIDLEATLSNQTVDSQLCDMLNNQRIDMEMFSAKLNKNIIPRTWNGNTWSRTWADQRFKAQFIKGLKDRCKKQTLETIVNKAQE